MAGVGTEGGDAKGVTQMELTAPVPVYLASFLVSEGLLPTKPPKRSSRQSWWLEGPYSPTDPDGKQGKLKPEVPRTCHVVNGVKYVLCQVDT